MLKHLCWGLVVGAAVAAGFGCSGKNSDDDDDSGGSSGEKGSGGSGNTGSSTGGTGNTGTGGTGNTGTGGTGNTGSGGGAVAECDALVGLYCPGIMDCLVQTGTISASQRDANVDACTTSAMSALDCSRAASVTASYDSCITALQNLDCDQVTAAVNSGNTQNLLPSVCSGVIILD